MDEVVEMEKIVAERQEVLHVFQRVENVFQMRLTDDRAQQNLATYDFFCTNSCLTFCVSFLMLVGT